jgi:hypothetical protein
MTNFTELTPVSSAPSASFTDRLRPAVAAYRHPNYILAAFMASGT